MEWGILQTLEKVQPSQINMTENRKQDDPQSQDIATSEFFHISMILGFHERKSADRKFQTIGELRNLNLRFLVFCRIHSA